MSKTAIEYLKNVIRPSVIMDIVDIAVYHGRRQDMKNAGHFSTPREVFCYIDHLGYIAYGDNSSTTRGLKFIKEFFPARYQDFAELIYAMWRFGTVHEYKPISYRASFIGTTPTNVEVRWLSTNHNRMLERHQHMLVFPMEGKPNTVYLVMNSCELADDLVRAVDKFISCLQTDHKRGQLCTTRIKSLIEIRDYTRIENKRMVPKVESQIKDAWGKQGGLLDERGNVLKKHPLS